MSPHHGVPWWLVQDILCHQEVSADCCPYRQDTVPLQERVLLPYLSPTSTYIRVQTPWALKNHWYVLEIVLWDGYPLLLWSQGTRQQRVMCLPTCCFMNTNNSFAAESRISSWIPERLDSRLLRVSMFWISCIRQGKMSYKATSNCVIAYGCAIRSHIAYRYCLLTAPIGADRSSGCRKEAENIEKLCWKSCEI